MSAELTELLNALNSILLTFGTAFLRTGGMVMFLPAIGEQSVPLRIRLALAFALTVLVTPAIGQSLAWPDATSARLFTMFAEISIGVFFGLLVRFFLIALSIAGTIAAQSTSLSQIFGGSAGVDPLPAFGQVMLIAGLALATMLNLHVYVVVYILDSYATVPFGTLPSGEIFATITIDRVAETFASAFSLASPFLIASVIYNVTLGVINRAMPQLMVSFVGAPVITGGGLLVLLMSLPFALSLWQSDLSAFLSSPFGGGF